MSSTDPIPGGEEAEMALTASADASARESEAEAPTVSHIEDSSEDNNNSNSNNLSDAETFVDLHLRAEIDNHLQSSPAALSVQAGTFPPPPPPAAEPESTTIDAPQSSSTTDAPFVRGHRRRSTHVTPRDLAAFRRDVLGVDDHWYEEEGQSSASALPPASDPEFAELNRAFDAAVMSLNNSGNTGGGPGPSVFSNYADNAQSPSSSASTTPRQLMSPVPQAAGPGNAVGMPGGMPMNAGHQMDLHHLYDMVVELSETLKTNRDITQNIVGSAEEIMVSR